MNADGSERQRLTSTHAATVRLRASLGSYRRAACSPARAPSPGAPNLLERGWLDPGRIDRTCLRPKVDLTVGEGWTVDVQATDASTLSAWPDPQPWPRARPIFPGVGCMMNKQREFSKESWRPRPAWV